MHNVLFQRIVFQRNNISAWQSKTTLETSQEFIPLKTKKHEYPIQQMLLIF